MTGLEVKQPTCRGLGGAKAFRMNPLRRVIARAGVGIPDLPGAAAAEERRLPG